jgi:MoaA/NifB/PqqE/SkfB family radical SAM enzyme
MLSRQIITGPRVRLSKIAILILDSPKLSSMLLKMLGFRHVTRQLTSGLRLSSVKLPMKRLKALLWIFINDKILIHSNNYQFSKRDILKKLDSATAIQKSGSYAGRGLVKRIQKQQGLFDSEYLIELLREHLRNDVQREFLQRKIMAITFDINSDCNRSCEHCFANSTNEKGVVVDYSHLKRALSDAREKLGCRFFNILGGEPFLAFEKMKTIALDFPYMPIQVFTNGDLLGEDVVSELEDIPNLIPLISLEGTPPMTDSIRGRGAYASAARAFKLLKSSKNLYGASITASKDNYEYLSSDSFAAELKEFGVYYVWIFDLKPIGRTGDASKCLTKEEKLVFNARISAQNKKQPFIFINTEKDPEVIGGCPATKGTYAHIFADGSVMPCITIRYKHPDLNISNTPLDELLESDVFVNYRNLSSYIGCAQQQVPEKFRSWITESKLVSLN